MNKSIKFLSALVALVCAACFASVGMAASTMPVFYDENEYVKYAAYLNGKTYVFTENYQIYEVADGRDTVVYDWAEGTFAGDSDGETSSSIDFVAAVASDDKIYAITVESSYDMEEETSTIDSARLCEIVFDENKVASLDRGVRLDWDEMIQADSDYEYSNTPSGAYIEDGKLVFTAYVDMGQSVMIYDIETGDYEKIDVEMLSGVYRYTDGYALAVQCMYENLSPDGSGDAQLLKVDLESGDCEQVCDIPMTGYEVPRGMCYDNGYLYYVADGEVKRMSDMNPETIETVCAIQLSINSSCATQMTDDGYLLLCDYQTVAKCQTDPKARASRTIRVSRMGEAAEKAYNDFVAANPDVDVALTYSQGNVVEDMMNRSGNMDVYCLMTTDSGYQAVFERGFMADMSKNESISSLVNAMYPCVQSAVCKDGAIYAVPIYSYIQSYGYNTRAFEKVGLTKDDVPKTWGEFFDFLGRIPDVLEDHSDMSVFEPGRTASELRSEIFTTMLTARLQNTAGSGDMSINTPDFLSLVEKIAAVDFEALGVPEELDSDSFGWSDDEVLFSTYANIEPSSDDYSGAVAMPLLVDGLSELTIPMTMTTVFVNPFSENVDLAIEYVGYMTGYLDDVFRVKMCPGLNDPIVNPYDKQYTADMEDMIADLQKQYDSASDEDKQFAEQSLKDMREAYDSWIKVGRYSATAESIARYREYAKHLTVMNSIGLDQQSGEIYAYITQFSQGVISARELLEALDQKLRMMMLEGV